jgi:predicted dehydrogenase
MQKVLILGLGRIGLGERNIKQFESHVNYFYKSKKYKVVGVVEKNKSKLNLLKKNFKKIHYFTSLNDCLKSKIFFDILQINFNKIDILRLLKKFNLKKKIFFFEKPLANNCVTFLKIIKKLKNSKILINYQRLNNQIYQKEFKKIKKKKNIVFNITYNSGLLNNASHIISLLIFYYGKPQKVKVHKIYNLESIDFTIFFSNNNKAVFINQKNVNYNLLEMDIYYKTGKISFLSGGHDIYKYGMKNYKYLNNYKLLNQKKKILRLNQIKNCYMEKEIVNNEILSRKYLRVCYQTIQIIEKLKKNA